MKKWIVLFSEGEPTWWNEKDGVRYPITYNSEREAQIAMITDFMDSLNNELDEFKAGYRDFDEIDIICTEYVDECDDDGTKITLRDGQTYTI